MKKLLLILPLILCIGSLYAQSLNIENDDSCRAFLCRKPWIYNNDTLHPVEFHKDGTFKQHFKGKWKFVGPATSYSGNGKDTRIISVTFEAIQRGNDVTETDMTDFELVDGNKLYGTPTGQKNGNVKKPSLFAGRLSDGGPVMCYFQQEK